MAFPDMLLLQLGEGDLQEAMLIARRTLCQLLMTRAIAVEFSQTLPVYSTWKAADHTFGAVGQGA